VSLILLIPAILLVIFGMWKIFNKTGVQPVLSVIPGINLLFLIWKVARMHILFFISYLVIAGIIYIFPISLPLKQELIAIACIMWVVLSIEVARNFKKSLIYGFFMGILPFIFYPVLGLSNDKYAPYEGKNEFFQNFEFYFAGVFSLVTVILVIITVFTRYCLRFTYVWSTEVAVGCFAWTIFLGAAGAFRQKGLMGVDILIQLTKGKFRAFIELLNSILVFVITSAMFYLSLSYILKSKKITSSLEVSYDYINASIVVSFCLMAMYSIIFLIKSLRILAGKEDYESENNEIGGGKE
jgi:TRAP-type C4-dicarboxylate transport system permease small subunit